MAENGKKSQGDKLILAKKSVEAARQFLNKWAQSTGERIRSGEPYFIVGAYSPAEIFKAMNIPTMSNFGALYYGGDLISEDKNNTRPEDEYNLLGICSVCRPLDIPKFKKLPKFTGIVTNEYECIVHNKALLAAARDQNASVLVLDATASTPYYPRYPRWWEMMEHQWDHVIEPHRLDYMVEQLKALIKYLESATGKIFDHARLSEVMEHTNEGCKYMREARNLIADTVPFPVSIVDIINVVGFWQSQHGTREATDVMKTFYYEVRERVDKGQAVCSSERIRLQWVKSWWRRYPYFYRAFEDKYGAVFGAAWYLSTGADCYARSIDNKDPLRALASRILFLGVYAGPNWDIYLAQRHKINGAVMHTNQYELPHCPNSDLGTARHLHKIAFENAGIPMLLLDPKWDMEKVHSEVSNFIETRLLKNN